jgi:hypothetical protein
MHLKFPAVDATYITQKIDAGFYSHATKLVRDAVRRMREADEPRQALLATAPIGDEQIACGEYRVYTPELFKEIKRNAHGKVRRSISRRL